MFKLRLFNFSQQDYEMMAAIHNQAYSDSRLRATDFKRIDDYTPQDEYDWERTVAEWDGKPVGYGLYVRGLWLSTPDLYVVGWLTHPEFRNRGIGSAYWDHLQSEIFPKRQISSLISHARTDAPGGRPFVENRGFQQTQKTTESVLDITTFDSRPHSQLMADIQGRGIVLTPLSELMESDPDHMAKLVELGNVRTADEPSAEGQEPLTEELFRNYYMSSDTFYPEGWFIAVDQGKYVGWCAVLPNPKRPKHVSNGITVIARDYRRIGLATAMKVHVIEHARNILGGTQIRTSNVSTNPMLQINQKLGYVAQYDSFEYKKVLA